MTKRLGYWTGKKRPELSLMMKEKYASGKRVAVWKNKKRPEQTSWLKRAYKEGRKKVIRMFSEKNPAWKGSFASYSAYHHWLENHKPRTYWCYLGNHKITRKSEFANLTGVYDHDVAHYVECCTSCHRLFDYGKLVAYANYEEVTK